MRKPFAALAAASFLLPFVVSAAETLIPKPAHVAFTDVPAEAWYASYVDAASSLGIVGGYKDADGNLTGKFGPADDVTIEQALKIAAEGAGYNAMEYLSEQERRTMTEAQWSLPYLAVCLLEGYFDILLQYDTYNLPATRADVAYMISGAFKLNPGEVGTRYRDVSSKTRYAAAVEFLSAGGVVSGDTDVAGKLTGTFRPESKINRAEVVKMVMKAREVYGTPGLGRNPRSSLKASDAIEATPESAPVVTYSETGFSPASLEVAVGTEVIFKNSGRGSVRVASNPHPTHTDLPGFDSKQPIADGGEYRYTFKKAGTFGYHNHMNPSQTGTIIVK